MGTGTSTGVGKGMGMAIGMYIGIGKRLCHERTGSARFVSVLDFYLLGSVRFGNCFYGSMRSDLRFLKASWFGRVRFGSVPRPVPAGSKIKRFGSVRFGLFGSVSYSFLLCMCVHAHTCLALSHTQGP